MKLRLPLVLGSSSPRRQFLLRELGIVFSVRHADVDESFPEMAPERVPEFLAEKKSLAISSTREILLTADTVVILGKEILNKPVDRNDAARMLEMMNGATHTVITGVCLRDQHKKKLFSATSEVTFKLATTSEIEDYIDTFKPFDKAGSYGAQECLPVGLNPLSKGEADFLHKIGKADLVEKTTNKTHGIGLIREIRGSYFNVMGLPIVEVISNLLRF